MTPTPDSILTARLPIEAPALPVVLIEGEPYTVLGFSEAHGKEFLSTVVVRSPHTVDAASGKLPEYQVSRQYCTCPHARYNLPHTNAERRLRNLPPEHCRHVARFDEFAGAWQRYEADLRDWQRVQYARRVAELEARYLATWAAYQAVAQVVERGGDAHASEQVLWERRFEAARRAYENAKREEVRP